MTAATTDRNLLHRDSSAGGEINPWIIAVTVTMATFMEVLDTSIANVALPHIAGGLAAGVDESTWVLTSYLVANAIVLPISAWISSVVGRKRFYMSCVALFTMSSLLCGLAPNLKMLIFFRVLQGLGGGGLQPSEQAILADTFPPAKRGLAFAVYGFAVVAAPAIGPTLGGYITDTYSWRWCFYINVPIGMLSLLLTSQVVREPKKNEEARKRRLREGLRVDYIGLGLIAVGLGFLQIALDKGQRDGWFGSNFITACVTLSAIAIIGAIIWEWIHPEPIIDLRLLRNRNFAASNILMFMLGFILLGTTVMIPEFAQMLLGYTAELAGLVISPGGVAVMLTMPLVGFLLSKGDARWMIAIGLIFCGWGLILMSHFDLQVSYYTVAKARVVQALGLAFLFVPINTVAYVGIPKNKNNDVSAFINLARNIGGSIGIAASTTLLARGAQRHQDYLAAHVYPASPIYQHAVLHMTQTLGHLGVGPVQASRLATGLLYQTVQQQANLLAYVDTFRLMAYISFATIPLVFLLKRPKPGAPMH